THAQDTDFAEFAAGARASHLRSSRSWFWVGVCAGLAALAKYSAFLLAFPLLIFVGQYLRVAGWRCALRAIGFATLGALVTAGGYYLRNLWVWGELVPMKQMALALPSLYRPHPFTLAKTLEFVPWLIASYWGVFVSIIAPAAYLETTKA